MISVQILELNDAVRADDWCRPLSLHTMSGGHSDSMSDKCMYTGRPENNVKWVRIDAIFGPMWFGEPLRKLNRDWVKYEVCRGNIPSYHRLNMSGYSSHADTLRKLNRRKEQYIDENDYDDDIPF